MHTSLQQFLIASPSRDLRRWGSDHLVKMTLKKTREEKLNSLASSVASLNRATAKEHPHERTLSQRIAEVKEGIQELRVAHVKFISDDRTTPDEKEHAEEPFQDAKDAADESLEAAEDKLELITTADTLNPGQLLNMDRERAKAALAQQVEKIDSLKKTVEAVIDPNSAQLDRLHKMITSQRVETVSVMKEEEGKK